MRTRFRRPVAALASAALILSLASPAGAFIRDDGDRKNSVPIIFDEDNQATFLVWRCSHFQLHPALAIFAVIVNHIT